MRVVADNASRTRIAMPSRLNNPPNIQFGQSRPVAVVRVRRSTRRSLDDRTMSLVGQKAKCSLRADVFRFGPNNRLRSRGSACPFGATSGLMRCSIDIGSRLVSHWDIP
jgi:hypothetical protein